MAARPALGEKLSDRECRIRLSREREVSLDNMLFFVKVMLNIRFHNLVSIADSMVVVRVASVGQSTTQSYKTESNVASKELVPNA